MRQGTVSEIFGTASLLTSWPGVKEKGKEQMMLQEDVDIKSLFHLWVGKCQEIHFPYVHILGHLEIINQNPQYGYCFHLMLLS